MDEKTLARFWAKVNKDGPVPSQRPDLGPCWVWTAYCIEQGYGRFRMPDQSEYAHRVAYQLLFGPIPEGLCVLHDCDNPPCVRHLYLGTQLDNAADRKARGRTADRRGERSGATKLTNEVVRSLRVEYAGGSTQQELSDVYGLTQSAVSRIVNRRTWSHV